MSFTSNTMRIFVAQINPTVGDIAGNSEKIVNAFDEAIKAKADIALFPELALTGYPPDDFLLLQKFIFTAEDALKDLASKCYDLTAIVGAPRINKSGIGKPLFNSAAIINNGKIVGYHDKLLLPTYDVFDERRYFEPGHEIYLWDIAGKQVAITICEDIWEHSDQIIFDSYARDPITDLLKMTQRPDFLLNLSASPYSIRKGPIRTFALEKVAATLRCPAVLCNQVGATDSLIFEGRSIVVNSQGALVQRAKGFEEDSMIVDIGDLPRKPQYYEGDVLEELYGALVLGVKDYFRKQGFSKACLGLSGGIDSALVACIAVEALGKDNVIGVAMPSRFSSEGSVTDAERLAKNLGIELLTIPIETVHHAYLSLLEPQFAGKPQDTTEENIQARIRGMILMALSNKFGYVVLNTGNKSEIAVGFATLYGDMIGGLSVISDLSKRRVYALSEWINRDKEIIPHDTIKKPPSAELRPNQKDSDSLPDYDHIDVVIEQYIEKHRSAEAIVLENQIPLEIVEDIIRRIHNAEYKRRQAPPGLRVTDKAFAIGRRFPIVQRWVK